MIAPALRVADATVTYTGGVQALAPITLDIAPRSFVSLVGPSGCGKSTLLRLLAGLLTPSTGTVARSDDTAEIGFVFQDATLMPWATVADNIALPLRLRGERGPHIESLLARVGLDGFGAAYPRALSGGMKMRTALARAIITNPNLLLMDEPFAALDEFTRFRLNDDLHALWKHNRWTVVFVTHSIREAVFLSERVVVMSPRPGRVIADLTVDLPEHRVAALRTSHAFADQCARVSDLLATAMAATESAA